jgi:acylphosphatase
MMHRQVVIRGRVQGVGFRAFVLTHAGARGLQGWVRNLDDGSVEAMFSGSGPAIDSMIAVCREGPPGASVDVIEERAANVEDIDRARGGFSVLPTA